MGGVSEHRHLGGNIRGLHRFEKAPRETSAGYTALGRPEVSSTTSKETSAGSTALGRPEESSATTEETTPLLREGL